MEHAEPNHNDREQRLDEALAEFMQRVDRGEAVDRERFLAEHADLADELRAYFDDAEKLERLAGRTADETVASNVADVNAVEPLDKIRYFGDYELLEEIARGGMGVVYKARQVNLNRLVALKMILAGQLASQADMRRFQAEAQAAANLQHPNIVAIHEVGEHEGQHYFSMDYIEGRSLAELIRESPLPPRQAAEYVKTIAEAIHYAHGQGTLHRDLKPSNVLIDKTEQPRITDFGLAKRLEADSNLTASDQIVGTPSYMPPEQAAGKRGEIGPASDVYSLGAILYELLTGRPPFRAATAVDTLLQVINTDPAAPRVLNPKVPADLETITLKCLSKQPQRRYASAKELAEDVGRYLRGEPIRARPIGVVVRTWRWCQRNPVVASLTGALAASLIIGLIGIVSQWSRAETEADRATREERNTRRHLYTAHMNLIPKALDADNLRRALELLNEHRPQPGQEDLRSFDWYFWWRMCHRDLRTFDLRKPRPTPWGYPHEFQIAISAEANLLALGPRRVSDEINDDSHWQVELRDASTGVMLRMLSTEGVSGEPAWLVFNPGGQALAVWSRWFNEQGANASSEMQFTPWVTLYDTSTSKERHQLKMTRFGGNDVQDVAVSPDGKLIAVATPSNYQRARKVVVWDVSQSNVRATLDGGGFVAFSPDGAMLAYLGFATRQSRVPTIDPGGKLPSRYSMEEVPQVKLWDVSAGKELTALDCKLSPLFAVYSPDGKHLAVGDRANVEVWNITRNGEELAATRGPTIPHDYRGVHAGLVQSKGGAPRMAAFSADSEILAVADRSAIKLWRVASGELFATLKGHTYYVSAVGFLDKNTLVSASQREQAVKLWKFPPDDEPQMLSGRERDTHDIAFCPDGRTLATSTERGLSLWNVATSERRKGPPTGGKRSFTPSSLAYSRDGGVLAAGGPTYDSIEEKPGVSRSIDVGVVTVRNLSSGEELLTLKGPTIGWDYQLTPVALSPDGKTVAVPHGDPEKRKTAGMRRDTGNSAKARGESLKLLNVANGSERILPHNSDKWFRYQNRLDNAELTSFYRALFSPSGKMLATVHANHIVLWDVGSGEAEAALGASELPSPPAYFSACVAFSPNGEKLATIHDDHVIRIWDVSPEEVRRITSELKARRDLATGDPANASNMRSRPPLCKPLASMRGHAEQVLSVAFCPDGRTVASCGADGTIKVWDVVTGEERLTLDAHKGPVKRVVFSPDGKQLVSGGSDGTIKVFHAATEESVIMRDRNE